MTNFLPQLNDLMFKTSNHNFMLELIGETTISDVNKHEIPEKSLTFKSFVDIIFGKWNKDVLIGMVI